MTHRIYIETSVVSYLTSRPGKDVIKLACQQITKLWWEHGRLAAQSYISPYVVEEASAGDLQAASERLEALREIPVLPIAPEIPELAELNTTETWHDPVIDEIHATREYLAEKYHNDLVSYSQAAESHCRDLGFKFVGSPRRQTPPMPIESIAHA